MEKQTGEPSAGRTLGFSYSLNSLDAAISFLDSRGDKGRARGSRIALLLKH
jgi:hypothetical protein